MNPGFLIGIFVVIFIVTWRYIWKRDVLFGVVYFFLFVYTIFAQFGYVYYPELSISIKAYFGPEIFYDVNLFVTLSFITFFLCFFFLHRYVVGKSAYKIVQSQPRLSILFYMAVVFHLLGLFLYFISNYNILDYGNASDASFQAQISIVYILFIIGFKLSVAINLLLYFLYRVRIFYVQKINRRAVLVFFVLEMVLFIMMTSKLGDRTDPLALMVAIVVLEISLSREQRYPIHVNKWKWVIILLLIVGVVAGLSHLEAIRNPGEDTVSRSIAEVILFKDYFAPSHILIAAMALDYVEPWKVIVSNFSNALVLLKQPYLQATVANLFNPGVSSRSASYAFYIFSEGYIFMGSFGFLYNGIVVFAGLAIWRYFTISDNRYYNLFMISLIATQAVNIVRGQSSYFIKDIYMFFIPAMVLFFLATGLRPWFGYKAHCRKSLANSETSTIKR